MVPFELLELNLRATLSVFCRAHPAGEVVSKPGLELICSGVSFSTFNAVLLTEPAEGPEEFCGRLRIAREYFRARNLPWSLWLCEDWLGKGLRRRLSGVVRSAGLVLLSRMPGMAAAELRPPTRNLPRLAFREVASQQERRAFEQIMTAAFGVPSLIARQIYGAEATWRDGLTGWVGYWGEAPVTTAATRIAAGVIGLYAVGTLAAFRGQGCAEAAVRHAIAHARKAAGSCAVVLQSTAQARPLYERLGFRTVTAYEVYSAWP
ncbi:MAG: GNAT family N-acetyltransferase [Bryobacterales bacterium]|nr:GNAT family N-acetyltransferase [Bryobacteraceae bacterium]MDW8129295.1 GNAT family N-acetyltransferase [Bryobacterales bacterium]